ncbi:glycosyltransferase family 39 protein [Undibacterium sp. RuRC25W]|uniref:glycosyltransferase family 39 protein n=1 Tax=Undibacterium sp. RuRC25W TaxID=3413047 RepID=UPI003BF0D8D9
MSQTNKSTSLPLDSPTILWTVAISFLCIWFYMLGARTLVPTDEGRYAEMAREMLATGDWVTLRLNGIKYFEKPPLQNWMNALTFAAFGLGDWQARLWTGLCGLIGVFSVAYTGRKIFSARIGTIAAIVLGSSFYWAGMGHVNSLDMGLSGMLAITMCGLLLSQHESLSASDRRNAMLVCWAGMALATMSKGLIGFVLPGTVLVIYTLVTRDWLLWTRLYFGRGLLLFFAITAPWFILIAIRNPEHPHFFFIHEHFQRFTSDVHHRSGVWYYFFPFLVLGIVPWLGLLLQGIWTGIKEKKSGFQPLTMLLIWAVFFFFFFSISHSKLPGYILPIFPALALMIAVYIENCKPNALKLAAGLLGLLGVIGLASISKIAHLGKDAYDIPLYANAAPWIATASAIAVIGGVSAWVFAGREKSGKDIAILCLAFGGFLAGQVAFLGHNPFGQYIAGISHVTAIKAELKTPTTPIYAVGRYEQALPFYLQRTMTLVEFPDEMEFGLEQQPELWIPKRNDFVQQWLKHQANHESAVAIVRTDIYQDFQQRHLPMRVIGQDPRRVIIATLTPNSQQ